VRPAQTLIHCPPEDSTSASTFGDAQARDRFIACLSALSILTTSFRQDQDRHKALGVWAAVAGLSSAAGVLLGPIFRLIGGERRSARTAEFDLPGAVLATGGMLH
jgi:hypothetical protein